MTEAPPRIRCLVNPASGRGAGSRRLAEIRALAERAGAEVLTSTSAADLTDRARRAAEEGVERLVVVGGDGTLHHAVRGLAGTGCVLAPVPVGSGNDLAMNLGVPRDPVAAAGRAFSPEPHPTRAVDLGMVSGIPFAIYCGVGFDSEVTRVANRVRRLRGPIVYPYATVRTLAGFRPPVLRIEHDAGSFEDRAMFVTVANAKSFGGGMRIAPAASMDDGLFDLVLVRRVPKWELLTIFPKVYAGAHVHHPKVEIVRTRSARLTVVDRPMELYGDGEELCPMAAGETVEVTMRPGALRVMDHRGIA
jgi:diacylglycerol kinase (ATP)